MDRDEILAQIRKYMVTLFDTPPDAIVLDADLVQDLDLDSIDAVDLVVELQKLTGRKIKPEEFKTVRTVGDIVERVYEFTHAKKA
ncbi:MAG: acyl carrier protein [Rhizomicrobium sp.]|jgi:acyl carrier protein